MSFYPTLGENINKRIRDLSSSFNTVSFVTHPLNSKIESFPSAQTFWQETETTGHKYMQAQSILSQRRVIMVTMIRVKMSNEVEATSEIYALLDELKNILVGYQPKIDGVYQTWPIYPIYEQISEASVGEMGIYLVWGLEIQEQVEVNSEYFSQV